MAKRSLDRGLTLRNEADRFDVLWLDATESRDNLNRDTSSKHVCWKKRKQVLWRVMNSFYVYINNFLILYYVIVFMILAFLGEMKMALLSGCIWEALKHAH